MDERKEGEPYFTWKDYVFGKNLGAATLQILLGIGALGVVLLIITALFG